MNLMRMLSCSISLTEWIRSRTLPETRSLYNLYGHFITNNAQIFLVFQNEHFVEFFRCLFRLCVVVAAVTLNVCLHS